MNRHTSPLIAVIVALLLAPGLMSQQTLEDRVAALEKLVGTLQTENAGLKETVADLRASDSGDVEVVI